MRGPPHKRRRGCVLYTVAISIGAQTLQKPIQMLCPPTSLYYTSTDAEMCFAYRIYTNAVCLGPFQVRCRAHQPCDEFLDFSVPLFCRYSSMLNGKFLAWCLYRSPAPAIGVQTCCLLYPSARHHPQTARSLCALAHYISGVLLLFFAHRVSSSSFPADARINTHSKQEDETQRVPAPQHVVRLVLPFIPFKPR